MIIRGKRQRKWGAVDESEALQTDIMRFLAIICMCLMIIFALIQSLPISETENQPKLQNKEILKREIEILKENASKLKQDLISLKKNVSLKKKQEEKFGKLNKEAKKELLKKQSDLNKTAILITNGKKKLKDVVLKLDKVQKEIKKEEIKNVKSKQDITKPSKKFKTKVKLKSKAITEKSKPVQKKQEGFTLGFESNTALLKLLKKENQVALYIFAGNKTWKLKVKKSGDVVFLFAPVPKKIYQMDYQTVPEKIIKAGKQVVATFGKTAITYAVVLTPQISHQFLDLMKKKRGGKLLISATGKVFLEDLKTVSK